MIELDERRRRGLGPLAKVYVYCGALCTAALLFVQAFHAPGLPTSDLDPSWELGLTEGHVLGLQFGKDIVFTFGPLGYLIHGLPTADTYLSLIAGSLTVAFVCAVVGTALAAEAGITLTARLIFVLALALVLPRAREPLYLATLLIWMLPVFRSQERAPLAALLLGTFSGFVALTELKLAFVALVGGLLIFTGRALAGYRSHERASGIANVLRFFSAYCIVYGFPFAASDYGWAVTLVLTVFAALAVSSPLWPQRTRSPGAAFTAALAAAIGLSLVMSPACRTFTLRSAEVASGYSVAMSVEGPRSELILALCGLAILTLLASVNLRSLSLPVALALALGVFGAFKEGFVRQDPPHVFFVFVVAVPVIAAVACLSNERWPFLSLGGPFIAIALFEAVLNGDGFGNLISSSLSPSAILQRAAIVGGSLSPASYAPAQFVSGLTGDIFPQNVRAEVGAQSVEILPWETSAIFANGFHWNPEPVFQAYVAYTAALDRINAAHLSDRGAARIFFHWDGVDGRYPLWDETSTYRVLLCRYRLAATPPSVVTSQNGKPFLALARTSERCGPAVPGAATTAAWNQVIAVPAAPGMTFAKLSIRYSALGYLMRELYRVPAVNITVTDAFGRTALYRIFGDTSNAGLLISPLPQGVPELAMLFSGSSKLLSVSSFTVSTDATYLFQPVIGVAFEAVRYR